MVCPQTIPQIDTVTVTVQISMARLCSCFFPTNPMHHASQRKPGPLLFALPFPLPFLSTLPLNAPIYSPQLQSESRAQLL